LWIIDWSIKDKASKTRRRVAHEISSLDIVEADILQLAQLPNIHRDPFDRIIIAQAINQGMVLVTLDNVMKHYPVNLYSPSV
jgi:PIN domain nuclease of toxin-antitoxin system